MPFVLKAYLVLIHFDYYLRRRDFTALYERVRRFPVHPKPSGPMAIELVCAAVDMASIWYWKEVLCLQRSAATTCLLRNKGVAAEMVIGTQQVPFRAHAWVEAGGRVVNDKPYTNQMYRVLDRC